MGENFCKNITPWTFVCFVTYIVIINANQELIQDLGLNLFPDPKKINISLDEYTTMMSAYLQVRAKSEGPQSIPKIVTFNLERKDSWQKKDSTSARLKFPINPVMEEVEIENGRLRLLVPPQPIGPTMVKVQVFQILGVRRRRFLLESVLYLSQNDTKWCDFDITSAVQSWIGGERNLGVELVCLDCESSIYPSDAAVTALVYPEVRRYKRSYQSSRKTECRKTIGGKKKCCRHEMKVVLKDLIGYFPDIDSIHMPQDYDAGFCQGVCPPNYNHATNHSRIQSLMRQMDRKQRLKNSLTTTSKLIPKACCAPSKLKPLDILRVDPKRPDKLMLETWENMQVVECSCS